MAPNSMANILIRRGNLDTGTPQEIMPCEDEDEGRHGPNERSSTVNDHQRLPASHQELEEKDGTDSSPWPQETPTLLVP